MIETKTIKKELQIFRGKYDEIKEMPTVDMGIYFAFDTREIFVGNAHGVKVAYTAGKNLSRRETEDIVDNALQATLKQFQSGVATLSEFKTSVDNTVEVLTIKVDNLEEQINSFTSQLVNEIITSTTIISAINNAIDTKIEENGALESYTKAETDEKILVAKTSANENTSNLISELSNNTYTKAASDAKYIIAATSAFIINAQNQHKYGTYFCLDDDNVADGIESGGFYYVSQSSIESLYQPYRKKEVNIKKFECPEIENAHGIFQYSANSTNRTFPNSITLNYEFDQPEYISSISIYLEKNNERFLITNQVNINENSITLQYNNILIGQNHIDYEPGKRKFILVIKSIFDLYIEKQIVLYFFPPIFFEINTSGTLLPENIDLTKKFLLSKMEILKNIVIESSAKYIWIAVPAYFNITNSSINSEKIPMFLCGDDEENITRRITLTDVGAYKTYRTFSKIVPGNYGLDISLEYTGD